MKRVFLILLSLVLCFSAAAESSIDGLSLSELMELRAQVEEAILKKSLSDPCDVASAAVQALLEFWKDVVYGDESAAMYEGHTGYLDIRSTRVFAISPTLDENDTHAQALFSDVKYVVEFVLFSDYMGTEPFYSESGMYNHVLVHSDGSMTVSRSPFDLYRSRTYRFDFTSIIAETHDFGGDFNGAYQLLVTP